MDLLTKLLIEQDIAKKLPSVEIEMVRFNGEVPSIPLDMTDEYMWSDIEKTIVDNLASYDHAEDKVYGKALRRKKTMHKCIERNKVERKYFNEDYRNDPGSPLGRFKKDVPYHNDHTWKGWLKEESQKRDRKETKKSIFDGLSEYYEALDEERHLQELQEEYDRKYGDLGIIFKDEDEDDGIEDWLIYQEGKLIEEFHQLVEQWLLIHDALGE